ncbi:MAG: transglycosylase SLT domain-containing protein [Myxococcota bacterium]
MKRVWPLAWCFGLLMSCHQQQHVRREVWPPPKESAPVVAHAPAPTPAPPPKVLDPTVVEMSDRSPVMQSRRALEKGNPSKAREIAEAAVGQANATDKGRLHWLAAQAAAKDGYANIAVAHFDALGSFNHPLAPWARLRRAMLLERREPATAAEILETLPAEWGGSARADAIDQRLNPKPSGGASSTASPRSSTPRGRAKQTYDKAQSYYEKKRYREAERLFGRVARSAKAGSPVWCDARYKQARSLLQNRDRTRGAPIMKEVAERCARMDTDTRAWARYHAARAYGRIGDWEQSIEQFERLEKEAPGHRLADDASYRAALAELETGNDRAAKARLDSIAVRYPEGDMWPRAMFRLGWLEFRDGHYQRAFEHFDALVEKGGDGDEEGMTGRANYWRARALFALGRRIDAVEAYAEIAERWPLRYYAQQSLWRLEEIVPSRAETIRANMRSGDGPSRMVFAWRDEFDDPAFTRMTELLIVGDTGYASDEMAELHMVGRNVEPEMAVVGAVLLQHAGADAKLSRVIRSHFEDFEGLLPRGEGRLFWEATYPLAFEPMIEDIAEDRGLPPAFVRAVAREESSFDPSAVSWAKAYGLVQLIMPTARRFAEEAGVKATPRTLKRPEVNLKIGTAYMAWLWDRFEQNPALIPSAYNAGEGAVRRWLDEDSARPLDVFIEEIPYDETRRYTRRVLQTYGVYQWLDDERLPPLPSALPRETARRYSVSGR